MIPAAGVAVALIAVVFLRMHTSVAPLGGPVRYAGERRHAQDYEVMADLDDLLASDDTNSLDESFFFSGRSVSSLSGIRPLPVVSRI